MYKEWLFWMCRRARDEYLKAGLWYPEDEVYYETIKKEKEVESLCRKTSS